MPEAITSRVPNPDPARDGQTPGSWVALAGPTITVISREQPAFGGGVMETPTCIDRDDRRTASAGHGAQR